MPKLYFFIVFTACLVSHLNGQNLYLSVFGEDQNETKLLQSMASSPIYSDVTSIKKGIDTLQLKLNYRGFINSELKHLTKENDSTYKATISLNKKIETVIVSYNSKEYKSLLKSVLKDVTDNKFAVNFDDLERTLNAINNKLSKDGLPFSKLKLENLTFLTERTLLADLVIDNKEKKRFVNDFVIKGYKKFPKSFLKHYLRIKKNRVFDINKIKEKTNALKSLRFANEVKPPEVLFTKDSTILYMYIEKKQSNAFDGFLGFNTDEDTDKLKLNGYVNLELTNNLNYGESLKIAYKSDANEQRSFDANVNMPYLFNSPFGIELQLNLFRKDSSFTTTQQRANVFYQIAQKHKLAANYKTSESNDLLNSNASTIEDFNNEFYSAVYTFTNNSKVNDFNEYNSFFSLEYGTGFRETDSLKTKQQLLNFNAHKIFNLNFNNSILLKINASALESDDFIENELFRFGGINSIRGFNENSLFANLYGVVNTEYRYKLSRSLFVHSIIDFGYLKNNAVSQEFNLYSFGFGAGMKTKGGVLRFNYANGRTGEESFKFSNSKIHLSLITTF